MRIVIYPYSLQCEGAIEVRDYIKSKGIHCFFAKREGSYIPKEDDFIVGWGCSKPPTWANNAANAKWINKWQNISLAVNKLAAFDMWRNSGIPIPAYTEHPQIAKQWLESGRTILARHRIKGHQGAGIEIIAGQDVAIPQAKFYSLVAPSTREFRVYSLNGKVIDVLEKRRQNGNTDPGIVRTEANGWVFCRQNVTLPTVCAETAHAATKALGLQFGGVDVLWNAPTNTAMILEINTAPGVFGTGVSKVGDALLSYQKEIGNAL